MSFQIINAGYLGVRIDQVSLQTLLSHLYLSLIHICGMAQISTFTMDQSIKIFLLPVRVGHGQMADHMSIQLLVKSSTLVESQVQPIMQYQIAGQHPMDLRAMMISLLKVTLK